MNTILQFLFTHLDTHPQAEIQDAVKFLYQASFGSGHMIPDAAVSYAYLCREAVSISRDRDMPLSEPMGNFARLDLAALQKISPKTLNAMFVASAKDAPQDKSDFIALLDAFLESNYFKKDQKLAYLQHYRNAGYPAVHHSDAYRAAYAPAYRVIRKEYVQFLDAFAAIDTRLAAGDSLTVAIDGLCGSGKSTLGALLASVYDCNLFHADDFYLPKELRTPERYAAPGGNVHWERIRSEILEPLKAGKTFSYRKFDCSVLDYGETVSVMPKALNILEGSYSTHPELIAAYDLKIFLKTPPEIQSQRILARNGPAAHAMFVQKWIPLENKYFETFPVEKQCDLVFTT